MAPRTLSLDGRLYDYVLSHSVREPAVLKELRAETAKLPMAMMQIGPDQGQFMRLLVELTGAKRAIDSCEHPFFPENFEQVIKARAGVASGNRETGRMDNRANLYPKLFRGRFHRSFNFAG